MIDIYRIDEIFDIWLLMLLATVFWRYADAVQSGRNVPPFKVKILPSQLWHSKASSIFMYKSTRSRAPEDSSFTYFLTVVSFLLPVFRNCLPCHITCTLVFFLFCYFLFYFNLSVFIDCSVSVYVCVFFLLLLFYWASVANAPNVLQPYWLIVLPLDVPDLTACLLL